MQQVEPPLNARTFLMPRLWRKTHHLTSLSLCLCLHTEFSLCLCHSFLGRMHSFSGRMHSFFAAGLLWPRNYAFCCCWTTFTLEIMVLCHVYPLLSMCKLCLPLTEHVQTLYWACAEIIYIIYPVFRWFKFTLKPPYSIACGKLQLAIWDTSFTTFLVKFGHKGPWDIS